MSGEPRILQRGRRHRTALMRLGFLPWLLVAGALVTLDAQTPRRGRSRTPAPPPESPAARAARIHRDAIVIDTHIDTTQKLGRAGWDFMARHAPGQLGAASHVDGPRMREGGLDAAFFSIHVPGTVAGSEAVKRALLQIDEVRQLVAKHPADLLFAATAADVRAAHKAGKIAVLLGMEGGHMIDDSLSLLRDYQRLGVRYLTLTHAVNTSWADSSGDPPAHQGLTEFGQDVVRELNRLGLMVDVSHVADTTFWDALAVSRAPLLASHSSARALSGHPRNMSDEMIQALAAKGGLIQINFYDRYLDDDLNKTITARRLRLSALGRELEEKYPGSTNARRRKDELAAAESAMSPLPTANWQRIVDHIDHVVKLVGAAHVGLGSDFDGAAMPEGMEDCTQLPKITAALLERGYSDRDVRHILGENLLRVMEAVEAAAKSGSP